MTVVHCTPCFFKRCIKYFDSSFNPYKSGVLFCGVKTNSADPDQTPQNAVFDQGLECLLTEYSKMKNTTQQPLRQKCLIDTRGKSWKFSLVFPFITQIFL